MKIYRDFCCNVLNRALIAARKRYIFITWAYYVKADLCESYLVCSRGKIPSDITHHHSILFCSVMLSRLRLTQKLTDCKIYSMFFSDLIACSERFLSSVIPFRALAALSGHETLSNCYRPNNKVSAPLSDIEVIYRKWTLVSKYSASGTFESGREKHVLELLTAVLENWDLNWSMMHTWRVCWRNRL